MAATVLLIILLIGLTPAVGAYMHRVYTRPEIGRVERVAYRLLGVDPRAEQTWKRYASCTLWFSLIGMIVTFLVLRFQGSLPLDPNGLGGVDGNVSFNTTASFATNTNWQAYGGETTMSYLSQMLVLTFQNFVSAAVGMAVLIAMIRGFTRSENAALGNFWRDTVRGVLYILLPLAIITGLFFVTRGVTQTLDASQAVTGIQGFDQMIARGPVASQLAIKQLGTNGGGFFNANSAHPFENPTPITGFVSMLLMLLLPAGLTATFGKMVGSARQGWVLFAAMLILFVAGLALTIPQEGSATPAMRASGIAADAPNLEGKEIRFGPTESATWAVTTTATSNGSVNSMHDSYQAAGMIAPMFNMGVGEVVFGGIGSGMFGMLFYAILAVFIGGLMVGRTPEYLGKKVTATQVKLVVIGIIAPLIVVLACTAVAVILPAGVDAGLNDGPHGFSEILYAFLSMGNNNGSAFAGLTANGPFYTIVGGIAMLASRFIPILVALSLGASVGREKTVPFTAGTLRTDTPLFTGLLVGVVVVIGALTFLPALALGPIVEHLMEGTLF